jgi:hypothetical protein
VPSHDIERALADRARRAEQSQTFLHKSFFSRG